jgi:hypothetical protein
MTLTFQHSKFAAPWDTHACQISSCYLQYCKSINKISDLGHIYLTSDLEGWPWPFTTQNVQLNEIHMLGKYQVAIFNIAKEFIKWAILATYIWPLTLKDDLDLSPMIMCSFRRCICMPNIKLLLSILQNVKVGINRPTNQSTDRQSKNNMSPTTIVGDIKIDWSYKQTPYLHRTMSELT